MFPLSSRFPLVLLLGLLFGLSGCTLDRNVLGTIRGGTLTVSPSLACPEDVVSITWDTHRPFNPVFCRIANGNTEELQRCDISSECRSESSVCLDSYCNRCSLISDERSRQTECAAPSNRGCQPNMNARILITPPPKPPLTDASDIIQHRGERRFVIREDSGISFRSEMLDAEGIRAEAPGAMGRMDLDQQVDVVTVDLTRIAPNAYVCRGGHQWPGTRLEELFADASPNLRLTMLHNPNGFTVVGNLNGLPLRLMPGERVDLNQRVEGPIQAQPDPAFLSTLPPVICTPTDSPGGGYPNAPLELTVSCVNP